MHGSECHACGLFTIWRQHRLLSTPVLASPASPSLPACQLWSLGWHPAWSLHQRETCARKSPWISALAAENVAHIGHESDRAPTCKGCRSSNVGTAADKDTTLAPTLKGCRSSNVGTAANKDIPWHLHQLLSEELAGWRTHACTWCLRFSVGLTDCNSCCDQGTIAGVLERSRH